MTLRLASPLAVLAALFLACAPAHAQSPKMSADDAKFDLQMRRWLDANPDVVLDAIRKHVEKEQDRQAKEKDEVVLKLDRELADPSQGPVIGDPKAKVTVTYVLDAACTYCRRMVPVMQRLADEKDVRVVQRWVPFLTPSSEYGARVATLVWKHHPTRYAEFYTAVMSLKDGLSNEAIDKVVAKVLGEDAVALIKSESTGSAGEPAAAAVAANLELAHRAGIEGTPFIYVQGAGRDGIFRGAVPFERIAKALEKARSSEKAPN